VSAAAPGGALNARSEFRVSTSLGHYGVSLGFGQLVKPDPADGQRWVGEVLIPSGDGGRATVEIRTQQTLETLRNELP